MKSVRELWNYTQKELRLMVTPGTWEMIFSPVSYTHLTLPTSDLV